MQPDRLSFTDVLETRSDQSSSIDLHVVHSPPKIYKRRWYVLAVFSLTGCLNYFIWNSWAPIERSASAVYNWRDNEFSLLNSWGLIMLIPFTPIFAKVLQTRGFRFVLVITVILMLLGTAIRLISLNPYFATWIIHFGQILNGIAGTLPMIGSSLLSITWFPPYQRRLATGISVCSQQFGFAISFIVGPFLVPEPKNLTSIAPYKPVNIEEIQLWTEVYLLLQVICVLIVFVSIVLYFPSKPPIPPSPVANLTRASFLEGLLCLTINSHFWLFATVFVLFPGFFYTYLSLLSVVLKDILPEKTCALLGFYATMAGSIAGVFISKLSDKIGHLKHILIVLGVIGFGSFLIFSSVIYFFSITENLIIVIFICIVMGQSSAAASVSLIYECSADNLFPVSEETVCGFLVFVQNIFCSFMLLASYAYGKESTNVVNIFGITFLSLSLALSLMAPNKSLRDWNVWLEGSLDSEDID